MPQKIKENKNELAVDFLEGSSEEYNNIVEKTKTIIMLVDKRNINKIIKFFNDNEDKDYTESIKVVLIQHLLDKQDIKTIIKLWDNISLSIPRKNEFIKKIKKLVLSKQELVNESVISFLLEQGIDDISMYFSLKDSQNKKLLMDKWYELGKNGKINDVVSYLINNELKDFNKADEIESIILRYKIHDERMNLYKILRVYNVIENMLLGLNTNENGWDRELDLILEKILYFKLEDRIISDKFILDKLDVIVTNKLLASLLQKSKNEKTVLAFWRRTDEAIGSKNKADIEKQLSIFLPFIVGNNEMIIWFINHLNNLKYDSQRMLLILEGALKHMRKYKMAVEQNIVEKEYIKTNKLYEIGNALADSITLMEKTCVRLKMNNRDKEVLIGVMKNLRRALESLDIKCVENIDNLNKEVAFDVQKHKQDFQMQCNTGTVESLGIKVNNNIIALSELKPED